MPAVIFPDTELWATTYLRAALAGRSEPYAAGVKVDIKVPTTRTDRMVIVRRDGGPRIGTVLEAARLGVRVFGKTEKEATDLANLARALLTNAVNDRGSIQVKAVSEQAGPSVVIDESAQPLRYFTAELMVRGSALT